MTHLSKAHFLSSFSFGVVLPLDGGVGGMSDSSESDAWSGYIVDYWIDNYESAVDGTISWSEI